MANANVKEFTDGNFQSEVLQSKEPVLVDFSAEWCGPCKMLAPTIDKLATSFAGKAKVGKIDTDAARDTAVRYGIQAVPTIIVFKNGQPVSRFTGLKSEAELAGALNAAIG
ncbi:MAG: thioredoxin [Phycisphaerales bacterium]|jgi:thioredoxin 1|nr:thioredoxin [Phycisphaeraceae bacterium]